MKRCALTLIAILILGMLTPCAQAASYTTYLTAAIDIYSGPGYDYAYVRDVGEDGTYTIVEEALCEDGLLWGRLKSGAGWVMLRSVYLDESYTVSLDGRAEIYGGPGYDYSCKGVIGEDGVFTIVAEMTDDHGNCWGKLKSGAGWVDLNCVPTVGQPPIAACFADEMELTGQNRCEYIVDPSEGMTGIAFRANERLTNVQLTSLRCDGDAYAVVDSHCSIRSLEEDSYFVAGVVFYGDMTTYGISFTDENGERRAYAVSLSGMDGALVMNEYT